jgi:hypothetical protein
MVEKEISAGLPLAHFGARRQAPSVMAGLVPAIHALLEGLSQIVPFAVDPIDKPHFPTARPMLHRLFALNCGSDVVVRFEINQAREAVPFRETLNQMVTMLITAAHKIARDTNIEDAVAPVGHDVNEAASHFQS